MLVEIKKLLNTGSPKVMIKPLNNKASASDNSSVFDCSLLSEGSNDTSLHINHPVLKASSKNKDSQAGSSQSAILMCDNISNVKLQLTDCYVDKSVKTNDKTSSVQNHLTIDLPASPLDDKLFSLNEDSLRISKSDLTLPSYFSFEGYEKNEYFDIDKMTFDLQHIENDTVRSSIGSTSRGSKADVVNIDSKHDWSQERSRSYTDQPVPSAKLVSVQSCMPVEIDNCQNVHTQSTYGGGHEIDTDEPSTDFTDYQKVNKDDVQVTRSEINNSQVVCNEEYAILIEKGDTPNHQIHTETKEANNSCVAQHTAEIESDNSCREDPGQNDTSPDTNNNADLEENLNTSAGGITFSKFNTTDDSDNASDDGSEIRSSNHSGTARISKIRTDWRNKDRPRSKKKTVMRVNIGDESKQGNEISVSRKLSFDKIDKIVDPNSSDSDYCPSEHTSLTDDSDKSSDPEIEVSNSGKKKKNKKRRSSNRLSLSFTNNQSGKSNCDETKLKVETSRGSSGAQKWNCCFFCHELQSNIGRHLMTHKDKAEVQKIMNLPKKGPLRRLALAELRKKGNYLFNTNPDINKGTRIVSRRPNKKFKKTGADFAHCAKCKGSYSKSSIRIHFAKCTGISGKKNHLVMLSSKQVAGLVHSSANDIVRRRIIPVLRDDNISRVVRYDELLITYLNKQSKKYRSEHFDKMLRQRLRMLGRLLLAIKSMNKNVSDFASIFDPEVYDDCIAAVNSVAGLDENTQCYKAPSTASMLGTLIKQIGKKHVADCIKRKETDKMKNAEDFLKLLDEDYTVSVNSTVSENQAERRRQKVIKIPSMDDIQKLHDFLSVERKKAFENLKIEYTSELWHNLAETSLTAVQLFNRRRAGEVERMKITDFEFCKSVDETVDKYLWSKLSENSRAAARKYVRFEIRGKKGRTVAVLLSSEMHECLKLILANREKAGVLSTNPYVFGLPSKSSAVVHRHFDACVLMRKFSEACGASDPTSLRGTELRKHMATKCLALNLNEQDVSEVANFMGHSTDIHKQVYRQTIVPREIMKMSKLLEKAQGDDSEEEPDSDENLNSDEGEARDVIQNNNNEKNTEKGNVGKSKDARGQANATALRASEVSANLNSEKSVSIKKTKRRRPSTTIGNESISKGIQQSNTSMAAQTPSPPTKKRRSSSPHGTVKRITWTQPEKDILLKEFGSCVCSNSKQFPSLKRITEFISKNPVLQARTPQQAKAWLSNQKQVNRRTSCM